jgi:hypothetical protein
MSVTSGRVYRRVKTTAVVTLFLSLCLVFAGVLNVRSASAEAMMFFVVEPAPISNNTTQTFEFFAFDTDTEGEYEVISNVRSTPMRSPPVRVLIPRQN